MSGRGVGGERGRGRGRGGRGRGGGGGDVGRGHPSPSAGPSGGGRGRGSSHYSAPPSSSSGPSFSAVESSADPSGGGRGRGRGSSQYSAPPSSSAGPSFSAAESSAAESSAASVISQEMEKKLTVHGSASSESGAPHSGTSHGMELQRVAPPSSSKAIKSPMRPGLGTAGWKIVVRANHFLVQVADRDLHHYDVSISPEVRSKKVNKDIMKQLQETYRVSYLGNRMLAYDGSKSAYAAGALPFNSKEFVIKLSDNPGGREREFKVSLKFAAKVDLYRLQQFLRSRQLDIPQETIQALDVVFRERPSNIYEVVGRSFFHPSLGRIGPLGNGVEYWRGFYQSVRPTQMGLSLNIDVSATAFYQPIPVIDFVAEYLNKDLNRPLSDQDRIKVRKVLRNVKVEVSHSKNVRRYRISGITTQSTSQLSFSLDGIETTIVGYFREKYNFALKHTTLPALKCGSDANPVYLPMEVCTIVKGQKYSKKLNDRQVTALLDAACQRPEDRENMIKNIVADKNYSGDVLLSEEFGIQIKTGLTSIDARVLPAPMIKYHESGQEQFVDPRVGQWNMINKKMVNGGKVDHWTCVNFSRNVRAELFCKELIDMCSSKGMVFHSTPLIPIQTVANGSIEKTLIDMHNKCVARLQNLNAASKHLQLLILILPDMSGFYGTVKRVCETELGIVSQCCHPRKASRTSKQYLENVALKINVKVGGRNAVLQLAVQRNIPFLTDRVTIVFGADVTHPQPGEDSAPSIAAVTASMDWPEVTKYRGLVSAQPHRKEIIQDLYKTDVNGTVQGGMIREQFIAFRKSTGLKPERIIFYRDGVSESQFNDVLLNEVDAIRRACLSLEANYMPRITFVVVQKRHHTRLFPANHKNRNSTDRSGNILPGTIVDTQICHPTEFDFYLCSHAGIKGTSRPTHYHVLYDENGFNADALQTLTYNLCYTYARCTRSVSIVPPAYYAHLAAFRARYYIEGEYSDDGSHSGGGGGGRGATREQNMEVRQLPAIKDNVKDVMFYC